MKKAVVSFALALGAAFVVVACSDVPTAPVASKSLHGTLPHNDIGGASASELQVCISGNSPASATYSVNASNVSGLFGTETLNTGTAIPVTTGNCVVVIQKDPNEPDVPSGSFKWPPATDIPVVSASVAGSFTWTCNSPEPSFCPDGASGSGATATAMTNRYHGSQLIFDFTPNVQACTASSIASNFNGTAIPAGRYIWFNSTAKLGSMTNSSVLDVTNAQVTFNSGGPITVNLPASHITFAAIANPAVTWNNAFLRWDITLPFGYTKDMFLGGGPYLSPGLPGGINPVTYSASFNSSTAGLKVQWKWAAAVYTSFSSDPGALGVGNDGKPSNFAGFAVGGARGGGAANMTGSWSGTGNAGVCTN